MNADEAGVLLSLLLVGAVGIMFAFGGLGIIATAGRKDADPMRGLKRMGGIALVVLFVAIVLSQAGVGQALHDIITGAWQNFLYGVVRPIASILMQGLVVVAVFVVGYLIVRRILRK